MSFVCVCPPKGLDFDSNPGVEDSDVPKRWNTDRQIAETVQQIDAGAKLILGDGGGFALLPSEDANQTPQIYIEGTCMVAFMGKLEDQGYLAYKTNKCETTDENYDAELIHGLYEQYGCRLLGKLRGQYSFAVFDADTVRVFAARDPSGRYELSQARLKDGTLLVSNCAASIFADFSDEVIEVPPGHYITGGRRCRVPQKFLPKAEELEAAKSAAADAAKRALSGICTTGRGTVGRISSDRGQRNSEDRSTTDRSRYSTDAADGLSRTQNPWRPTRGRPSTDSAQLSQSVPVIDGTLSGMEWLERRYSESPSDNVPRRTSQDGGSRPAPRASYDGGSRLGGMEIPAPRKSFEGRRSSDSRRSTDEERPKGRADSATTWRPKSLEAKRAAAAHPINPNAAPFVPAALKPSSPVKAEPAETWVPITGFSVADLEKNLRAPAKVPENTQSVENKKTDGLHSFPLDKEDDAKSEISQEEQERREECIVEDGDALEAPITMRLAMHGKPAAGSDSLRRTTLQKAGNPALTATVKALHKIASEGCLSRMLKMQGGEEDAETPKGPREISLDQLSNLGGEKRASGMRRTESCREFLVIDFGKGGGMKRVSSQSQLEAA